jgi:serine/threonine protein kinase, bacterial
VLKLAAGSETPTVLPFTGLKYPEGVAVDTSGNVYVADEFNNRVLKLAAGSDTPTVLPFTGLRSSMGVRCQHRASRPTTTGTCAMPA